MTTTNRYLQRCRSRKYLQDPAHVIVLKKSLSRMTTFLAKHYDRRVVLLIEDWSVPLHAAAEAGYYPLMLDFLQFFLAILERGSPIKIHGLLVLKKTVLTGTHPVSLGHFFIDPHYFDDTSFAFRRTSFLRIRSQTIGLCRDDSGFDIRR